MDENEIMIAQLAIWKQLKANLRLLMSSRGATCLLWAGRWLWVYLATGKSGEETCREVPPPDECGGECDDVLKKLPPLDQDVWVEALTLAADGYPESASNLLWTPVLAVAHKLPDSSITAQDIGAVLASPAVGATDIALKVALRHARPHRTYSSTPRVAIPSRRGPSIRRYHTPIR
jgi:hypothetical protein